MPTTTTTTSDDKLKKTADSLQKIANDGIGYTYQFDWFSIIMMGMVGITVVVITTVINWYLNRI